MTQPSARTQRRWYQSVPVLVLCRAVVGVLLALGVAALSANVPDIDVQPGIVLVPEIDIQP